MTVSADKARLRAEARTRVRECLASPPSTVPCRRLLACPRYTAARTVLLYMALPDEADIAIVADHALAQGKRLVLPRVDFTRPGNLCLHEVTSWSETIEGAYSIREPDPARCAEVEPAEVDFVAVPGLAFDRSGTRLGRGGGYYDRLLGRLRPDVPRYGIFYSCQEFPMLPREPHDVPLHAVLTEREFIECVA